MATENYTKLGVYSLLEEATKPGQPPLTDQGWSVDVKKIGDYTYFKITNTKKGSIEFMIVRAMLSDGRVIVWTQPVWTENPGAILAPVRKLACGKGQKADQIIVYLAIVGRPIVEPKVNIDPTLLPTKQLLELVVGNKIGIKSIEFPRGVGPRGDKRGVYQVTDLWKQEKFTVLGNIQMFDAMGAADELAEEAPQFTICPGAEPMLVGALNPNTALFKTSPGAFVIPISPKIQQKEMGESGSELAKVELIQGIVPFRHPEETDELLDRSERLVQSGVWNGEEPILIDPFTISMLGHIDRLNRRGRLLVTG